jgi:branched-chain amino acid transport system permease protein
MRAVADNPELARASGIRARPVMATLWALVGVCSAVGGIMLGLRTVVVPEMGWNLLLPAFAAAVLGGAGNPAGAVLAGLGLGLAEALSTPVVGFTYQTSIAFVVLIAALALRPHGLLGQAEQVR